MGLSPLAPAAGYGAGVPGLQAAFSARSAKNARSLSHCVPTCRAGERTVEGRPVGEIAGCRLDRQPLKIAPIRALPHQGAHRPSFCDQRAGDRRADEPRGARDQGFQARPSSDRSPPGPWAGGISRPRVCHRPKRAGSLAVPPGQTQHACDVPRKSDQPGEQLNDPHLPGFAGSRHRRRNGIAGGIYDHSHGHERHMPGGGGFRHGGALHVDRHGTGLETQCRLVGDCGDRPSLGSATRRR